jgi:Tol biopolymer transport system component
MKYKAFARPTVLAAAFCLSVGACATVTGGAPAGGGEDKTPEEIAALKKIGSQVKAKIVWSSSRLGNHDLFSSDADGGNIKQLTKGDEVDWFPRFSPDGGRILFTRSQKGWVSERDANSDGKWDLYTLPADGGDPTKIVDNASWGTWVDGETILFVRGTKLFRKKLAESKETALLDSEKVDDLSGALLQQPEMAHDGRYIAITLRGSKRETGIWDLQKKTWTKTGEGCQINWTPDGKAVYWVHPTGNGGSRVFRQEMAGNKPTKELSDDERTFIDLPGRRSHEYFPQLSADGHWLVWAATQRGHDHDIVDYEIYLWQVGRPAEEATRLTFHSGNDRWPDIFIPGAVAASTDDAVDHAADGKAKTKEADPSAKVATDETSSPALVKASTTSSAAKEKAKLRAKLKAQGKPAKKPRRH